MPMDLTKMQDITISEKADWEEYQSLISLGTDESIQQANQLIIDKNLQYKVHNAFNWNRLINAISDKTEATDPTNNSLEGQWNSDFSAFGAVSLEFSNKGDWGITTNYKKNNLVKYNNVAYICKIDNMGNTPTDLTFWNIAYKSAESLGLQVATAPPLNLYTGDLFFQIEN